MFSSIAVMLAVDSSEEAVDDESGRGVGAGDEFVVSALDELLICVDSVVDGANLRYALQAVALPVATSSVSQVAGGRSEETYGTVTVWPAKIKLSCFPSLRFDKAPTSTPR